MKHTKLKYEHSSGKAYRVFTDDKEKPIAIIYGDTKHDAEASAKLIAAAPDLLSALKEILLVLEMGMASPKDMQVFNNSKAVITAKEAIKKAGQ